MNKILITGGAGCLGSNLVDHLIPLGFKVCVIDNYSTGNKESLPASNENFKIVEGTVYDESLVDSTFKSFKPECVIHSAASYKDPNNWIEDTNTNVIGSINIAKSSKENNVKKIINFQTALCYGSPKVLPIPINHKLNPITSYGITKTAGESFLMNSGLPVVSLRLANICAPRLSIGPIPTFFKRINEGKECFCTKAKRDFLDIKDFLDLMDILINLPYRNGIFNVSTGKSHSIKDIYNEVATFLGKSIKDIPEQDPEPDDIKEVVLDPKETIKEFNWNPKIDFKNIIKNQLEWYVKYGVTNIYSHLNNK
tara:strand:- start:408 stop:1337 length:930 start_codon:yes stop_codon:yes gene_type:complete